MAALRLPPLTSRRPDPPTLAEADNFTKPSTKARDPQTPPADDPTMTDSTAMTVHPWARPGPLRTAILVMGSAGAAAIHFAMMPAHAAASTLLAVAFGLVAWLQAAFAVARAGAPDTHPVAGRCGPQRRRCRRRGRGAGCSVCRSGSPAARSRLSAAVDALCAVLEIGVVTAAVWPTRVAGNAQRRSTWAVVAGGLATLLVVGATSAVLAAPSAHDHADGHANADTATLAHTEHTAGTHDHAHGAATPSQAATPAVEPAGTEHQHSECTAPVTNAQRAAADALVANDARDAQPVRRLRHRDRRRLRADQPSRPGRRALRASRGGARPVGARPVGPRGARVRVPEADRPGAPGRAVPGRRRQSHRRLVGVSRDGTTTATCASPRAGEWSPSSRATGRVRPGRRTSGPRR